MDTTFLTGIAAFVSAIIVFCGSVWLLLALIMGPKLSYLITASVTLGFVLIMGLVWSYGDPLGPVGELPSWGEVDIAAADEPLDFGPAGEYPEGEWQVPDPEDAEQVTQTAELNTAAADYLEASLQDVGTFESFADATINSDLTRLLVQDGDTYGAVTFEVVEIPAEDLPEGEEPPEGEPTVAVMKYDAGNPSRPARLITAGTFILFVAHLIALSMSERNAKKKQNGNGTTTA